MSKQATPRQWSNVELPNGKSGFESPSGLSAYDVIEATPEVLRAVNAHEPMLNALHEALEQFKPTECNCDGEYIDGEIVGYACYFHRIEDVLKRAITLAEEGK